MFTQPLICYSCNDIYVRSARRLYLNYLLTAAIRIVLSSINLTQLSRNYALLPSRSPLPGRADVVDARPGRLGSLLQFHRGDDSVRPQFREPGLLIPPLRGLPPSIAPIRGLSTQVFDPAPTRDG